MTLRYIFYTVLAVCMICLCGQAGDCDVIKHQGVSRFGVPMDLGKFKMPWSRANNRFGYVYAVEGVSFANVIPGPPSWTCHGYYSYTGVKADPQTFNPHGIEFSSKALIVFDTLEEKSIQSAPVPTLLIRHNGEFGVIEFLRMDDYGLHYRYGWIGSQTPLPDIPPVQEFDEPVVYFMDSDTVCENLTITNGATVFVNAGLHVNGSIKILQGTLILDTVNPVEVNDVSISEGSTLILGNDTRLIVTGNWINHGVVLPCHGTVVFSGEGPQKITGSTYFNSLEIDTGFQVEADPMRARSLSIYSGIFAPATNSRFHNVFIDTKGVLLSQEGAEITISGHMDNEGGFVHNYGTVILNGSGPQEIHTNGDSFFNLLISGEDVRFSKPPIIKNRLFFD
ncbi:MAG: hypothetical protein GY737_06375 [Desulfobacteraceae bacterium]|nr:hypothetical protein [Desulfobacteraceae bacterium]